jgi:electron transport complex protein RnfG
MTDKENNVSAEASNASKNEHNSKYILTIGLKLFAICLVVAVMLAVVNQVTMGPIQAQKTAADEKALTLAVPEADTFEDVAGYTPSGIVQRFYNAKKGSEQVGYCVKVAPKGFGGEIILMVGLDKDAAVTGISLVSMSETAGVGTRTKDASFLTQFIGKSGSITVVKKSPEEGQIEAISGATISSKAITAGVQAAIDLVKIQGQGGK